MEKLFSCFSGKVINDVRDIVYVNPFANKEVKPFDTSVLRPIEKKTFVSTYVPRTNHFDYIPPFKHPNRFEH